MFPISEMYSTDMFGISVMNDFRYLVYYRSVYNDRDISAISEMLSTDVFTMSEIMFTEMNLQLRSLVFLCIKPVGKENLCSLLTKNKQKIFSVLELYLQLETCLQSDICLQFQRYVYNFRDVFTTDVFGFLVYEAISNGESVLIAHKNKQTCSLTMRR